MTSEEFRNLIQALIALQKETEWVEFKWNKADPEEIGEYLSALSNSAALCTQANGYIVWGISNETHEIVGTSFRPRRQKVGNEELENWLLRLLTPRIDFQIHEDSVQGKPLVILQVQPATNIPVRFRDTEFIRVGSYKKKLREFPERERTLWSLFSRIPFESSVAASGVSSNDVLKAIDYPSYFRLMDKSLPDNRKAILDRLVAEKIVVDKGLDRFDICNVGAILFAYDLRKFDRLARKATRVIIYESEDRTRPLKEQMGAKGYAVGFEGLISYINDQLPQNEQVEKAFRREVRMYPEEAIRELVANALIHQDLNLTGTGPRVEIFSDRMEITNPGIPLIDTMRFIDGPPRSRNEILASLMRRMHMCEERGSGIDRVIAKAEVFQLPAPDFRVAPDHTVAVLFAHKSFEDMDRNDRVRACYQHCCLRYIMNQRMTNESLRERFKLPKTKAATVSQVIAATLEVGWVRLDDNTGTKSKRYSRYIPFWV
jgi:ATP-dependent DNA helicase RecG